MKSKPWYKVKISIIYITISTFTSVRPYGVVVGVGVTSRHTFKLPIPAVDSQNVSNKSCLACAQK